MLLIIIYVVVFIGVGLTIHLQGEVLVPRLPLGLGVGSCDEGPANLVGRDKGRPPSTNFFISLFSSRRFLISSSFFLVAFSWAFFISAISFWRANIIAVWSASDILSLNNIIAIWSCLGLIPFTAVSSHCSLGPMMDTNCSRTSLGPRERLFQLPSSVYDASSSVTPFFSRGCLAPLAGMVRA